MIFFVMSVFLLFEGDPVAGIIILVIFAICGILSLALYAAPSAIAIFRNHPQIGPIMIINLLLGWTFVGWVVAMAWSLSSTRRN